MTSGHVPPDVLTRYVATSIAPQQSDVDVDPVWWAIEAHLEHCVACRDRLRTVVSSSGGPLAADLRRVHAELATRTATGPAGWAGHGRLSGRARAWLRWWVAPVLLPRLATAITIVAGALALDLADRTAGRFPSVVLLLAPVLPLLGVAAAWSRGLDPAYELVVGSPRAGLDLVLRRAAIALAGITPVLAVAGWVVGYSPARWLLPCLAFTVAALALGGLVGVQRAATVLAAAWGALVVLPSLVLSRLPAVLAAEAWPGWAIAALVVAVVMVVRRRAFAGLASGR